MAGASIEATLELWASSLRDVKAQLRPLFGQERVAASAWKFLDGLLGNEPRKTGWMRAEAAGDPGPWRQQAILGRGRWDADALRESATVMLGDATALSQTSSSQMTCGAPQPARLVLSPVLCGPLALLGVCSRPPCLPPPTHALSGNFEPKREVRLPLWQVRS